MEAFAEGYQRGANRAAIYMRQIIDHVKNNDPEAILFMFGDHGAFHSLRGLLRLRMIPDSSCWVGTPFWEASTRPTGAQSISMKRRAGVT